jgi:hypothetical protein
VGDREADQQRYRYPYRRQARADHDDRRFAPGQTYDAGADPEPEPPDLGERDDRGHQPGSGERGLWTREPGQRGYLDHAGTQQERASGEETRDGGGNGRQPLSTRHRAPRRAIIDATSTGQRPFLPKGIACGRYATRTSCRLEHVRNAQQG